MTKLNRSLIVVFAVLMLYSCHKSETPKPKSQQQEDIAAVDKVISGWMTSYNMPGMSLAVSENGKLVYAKGYGDANTDTHEKVSTESQFRIASVSKLITSAAIMKLVQDGKISMDQKVFGTNGVLGTSYGTQPYKQWVTDITISQLLHHTGGGWGQDNDPAFFDITQNKAAIINWTINNLPLKRKPGTGFDYSNFGYMLLAQVVEKVSGKSYNQFVNDEIWKKTGAMHSVIAGAKLSDKLPKEVVYYGQGSEGPYNMNLSRGDGAMGWLSTPTDLLRFATAVDGSNTRPDILSASTITTMTTTTSASTGFGFHFGCGWVVEGDEWFWWGSLPGTFAILYRNGNGICIAATANSRRQPAPENSLNAFFGVINYLAFTKDIPWQDIDQF